MGQAVGPEEPGADGEDKQYDTQISLSCAREVIVGSPMRKMNSSPGSQIQASTIRMASMKGTSGSRSSSRKEAAQDHGHGQLPELELGQPAAHSLVNRRLGATSWSRPSTKAGRLNAIATKIKNSIIAPALRVHVNIW